MATSIAVIKKLILIVSSILALALSTTALAHNHRLKLIVRNTTKIPLVFQDFDYGPKKLVDYHSAHYSTVLKQNERDIYEIHVHKHTYSNKSSVDTDPMQIVALYYVVDHTGAKFPCVLKVNRKGYAHSSAHPLGSSWVNHYRDPEPGKNECHAFHLKANPIDAHTIEYDLEKNKNSSSI